VSKELEDKLEELHEDVQEAHRKDASIITWLWRGILFGIGSTVGVAAIFYVFILIAEQLAGVPILGTTLQSLEPLVKQTVETRVPNAQKLLPNSPLEVSDPASRYRLEVPKTWTVTVLEGADGVQVSKVEVESPEFQSRVDESTNTVYYEDGMKLGVAVVERGEPVEYTDVVEERKLEVAGEAATYTVYRKGNTAAGILTDVTFAHASEQYSITFAYNPEAFLSAQAIIDDILASFSFSQ
jgi:hypothetical protein